MAPAGAVVIVGGGLAGGLLALALRERGAAVILLDAAPAAEAPGACAATTISYGAIPGWPLAPTPLARLAAGASRRWRRLQRRHGPLGWRPARLRLHGTGEPAPGLLAFVSRLLALPFSQVDTAVFTACLPQALQAAGVELLPLGVRRLRCDPSGAWQVHLSDGSSLSCRQLVLAAGAACRDLWPELPQRLRSSWAAVLELPAYPTVLGGPACWLPQAFERVPLERAAAALQQPRWVVDAGLVPRGAGALLGQFTLVRPDPAAGVPPPAAESEQRLRQSLAAETWGASLAALPGELRQAAVAFCSDGVPLVGPLAQGLWVFTGFSAGFSQVPVLAPLLAACLADSAEQAQAQLQRLGVWPRPVQPMANRPWLP